MMMKRLSFPLMSAACLFAMPVMAAPNVLFDVKERTAELQRAEYIAARQACKAENATGYETLPEPITGLKSTNAYGSDNRAEEYAWHLMVYAGRALAGEQTAVDTVKKALLSWAEADALAETEEAHDTYYALKRLMLPTIISYDIVYDELNQAEQQKVTGWIDGIVRRVDTKFDGDVDHNNHRYSADATLMAWGAFIDDEALYQKGIERFHIALQQAEHDGSLPLETRRGSRSAWYIRQALANLTSMAETARMRGDDLYDEEVDGKSVSLIMTQFLNAVHNPLTLLAEAGKNYIPGPHKDPFVMDTGMLKTRGHQRHYMAFTEAYLQHAQDDFANARLRSMLGRRSIVKERPLIDEFIGGNATCFWWKPGEGEQL
jgi:poly(beta-D-mannuronate) lyase